MDRVKVPLPGMELGHVNAYVLRCGDGYALVDVGIATYDAAVGLLRGLRELGVRPWEITRVFVTHFHADHSTLLSLLSHIAPAEYYIGEAEFRHVASDFDRFLSELFSEYLRQGVPKDLVEGAQKVAPMVRFRKAFEEIWGLPWRLVRDGEGLPCGLRALWTPGHTPGHIVYVGDGFAFTGDHILPKITPNISYWYKIEGYDPLGEYLRSLSKSRGLGLGYPAHGEPIADLDGRIREIERHHEERLAEIEAILAEGPMTAFEVARRVRWDIGPFDGLDVYNKFFAVSEALSHLVHLEFVGRAESREANGVVYWRRAA
ncbi:MAG: MBL fold metallo-hydrolase [Thermoproteus sp.]